GDHLDLARRQRLQLHELLREPDAQCIERLLIVSLRVGRQDGGDEYQEKRKRAEFVHREGLAGDASACKRHPRFGLTGGGPLRQDFPVMRRALVVWLALVLVPTAPRFAHAWQTEVANTPPTGRPLAVAVDGAGDVLTGGRVVTATNDDGIVAKLAGLDGAELWQQRVSGSADLTDQVRGITSDATNVVVAVGQVINTGTNGDALVLKLDPTDGHQLWRLDLDGGASLRDDALAVVMAGADAIVAGATTLLGGTDAQMSVQKRAGADGASLWHTELSGTPGAARAVVLSGADVFVAGDVAGLIVVAKVGSANGALAWRTDVAGSATPSDMGRALAVGGGRAVVAGHIVTD